MDKLKSAISSATHSSGSGSGSDPAPAAAPGGAPAGGAPADANKEDYGDKGLDAIEKKFGQDPTKLRSVNEKITDGARDMFEKQTGKKVPEKFSN